MCILVIYQHCFFTSMGSATEQLRVQINLLFPIEIKRNDTAVTVTNKWVNNTNTPAFTMSPTKSSPCNIYLFDATFSMTFSNSIIKRVQYHFHSCSLHLHRLHRMKKKWCGWTFSTAIYIFKAFIRSQWSVYTFYLVKVHHPSYWQIEMDQKTLTNANNIQVINRLKFVLKQQEQKAPRKYVIMIQLSGFTFWHATNRWCATVSQYGTLVDFSMFLLRSENDVLTFFCQR